MRKANSKRGLIALAFVILNFGCSKNSYVVPDETAVFPQTVTYNTKVDLVIMVDNSSSMSTYQNRLANQAPLMIQALNTFGMDYQIVVVTTDMRAGGNGGMFVGSPKVLTPSTANLSSVLSTRIKQGNGGSDLERGLESIEQALTNETGFLRRDALLAVLALSNEDDYSTKNAEHYVQFFNTLKPKFNGIAQGWVVNFVGVPSINSNCSTALDGIYKEPGFDWVRLAEESGGLVQEICDTTLGAAVDNIRKRIVAVLSVFALSKKPIVDTISVKINGVVIPESKENGWEYLPTENAIKLHGSAVPGSASDAISIDFTPAEAS